MTWAPPQVISESRSKNRPWVLTRMFPSKNKQMTDDRVKGLHNPRLTNLWGWSDSIIGRGGLIPIEFDSQHPLVVFFFFGLCFVFVFGDSPGSTQGFFPDYVIWNISWQAWRILWNVGDQSWVSQVQGQRPVLSVPPNPSLSPEPHQEWSLNTTGVLLHSSSHLTPKKILTNSRFNSLTRTHPWYGHRK